jgi:hypothetical protein
LYAPHPQEINRTLEGKHAEMWWPDDGMWYLIEIQEVIMQNHNARIVYVTGEVETLDLKEIVRDQHMILIPSDFY